MMLSADAPVQTVILTMIPYRCPYSHRLMPSTDIYNNGWCVLFLPLYHNKAQVSRILALPCWAGDIIWNQGLHCSHSGGVTLSSSHLMIHAILRILIRTLAFNKIHLPKCQMSYRTQNIFIHIVFTLYPLYPIKSHIFICTLSYLLPLCWF